MTEDEKMAAHVMKIYDKIDLDIKNNINLEGHLADVNTAIETLQKVIAEAKTKNRLTESYDIILNNFFRLKYEIGERT